MHEQSTNHISPKIGLDVIHSHPLPAQDVFWSISGLHGVIGRWYLVNLAQDEQRLTIFRCGYSMTEVGQGSTGEDHQTPSARVCVECGVCGVCVECVWSECGVW